MYAIFEQEVMKLKDKPYVDQDILQKFLMRISSKKPLTKTQNKDDHFGSFLLPLNRKDRKIYMGHHIKANIWLPPGGHIEENESPEQAMRREFQEELGVNLVHEETELFNLSITFYQNHWHYDFWFLIYTDLLDFKFDRREFLEAKWINIDEIPKYMDVIEYTPVIEQLTKYPLSPFLHN